MAWVTQSQAGTRDRSTECPSLDSLTYSTSSTSSYQTTLCGFDQKPQKSPEIPNLGDPKSWVNPQGLPKVCPRFCPPSPGSARPSKEGPHVSLRRFPHQGLGQGHWKGSEGLVATGLREKTNSGFWSWLKSHHSPKCPARPGPCSSFAFWGCSSHDSPPELQLLLLGPAVPS